MITHGFTVDAEGKKISKSLGNDVDTHKLIAQYGAEILRLWTIMVDYREDMRFSDEMMKRVAEAYRKVRNTCRYLLSNLYDFDPGKDAVAEADLDDLDRYALNRHREVVARVLEAYDAYEFHVVYHQLVQYCAADLSVLLPGRAQGPSLLRRRGERAAALRPDGDAPDGARPRHCCCPPSCPSPPTRSGRSSRGAGSPPCTSRSSRGGRAPTRRCSSAGRRCSRSARR